MKTIEVNLIGDLKQKAKPKKLAALQEKVVDSSNKPEEAKNTIILIGIGGSAIIGLIVLIIIWLGTIVYSFVTDTQIADIEKQLEQKNLELVKYTKIRKNMKGEITSLKYKEKLKKVMLLSKAPFGELLEEIRAKIPQECNLIEVKKAKNAVLIKGTVYDNEPEPLRIITHFIINLNTIMPKVSLIKNAFLASVVYKEATKEDLLRGITNGSYEFVIKTDVKNTQKKGNKTS